jgi:ABC-2 type transport system ATP-binding protein
MEQVEEICEHIVLINQGKNILEGKVKDIKNQYKKNLFQIDFEGNLPNDIGSFGAVKEQKGDSIVLQLQEGQDSNKILRHLMVKGLIIHAFNEILPSLNEIFIRQVEEQNNQI